MKTEIVGPYTDLTYQTSTKRHLSSSVNVMDDLFKTTAVPDSLIYENL